MLPAPDMFIIRGGKMTEAMQTYLYRSPIPNLKILASQQIGDGEFTSNELAPHKGVMCVAGKRSPLGPFVQFSEGDPAFQLYLTDLLPRPYRYSWSFPNEELYQELAGRLGSAEFSKMAVYTRPPGGLLPTGPARQLTKADRTALLELRPDSAKALTGRKEVRLFGVIEDGHWVADAWVLPMYGRHWAVNDLTVHPDYLRRGYGKAALAACLNFLSEAGMTAVYETDEDNAPSRHLVEGLGFRLEAVQAIGRGTLDWPPSEQAVEFFRRAESIPAPR